jgi:hypothetical protein
MTDNKEIQFSTLGGKYEGAINHFHKDDGSLSRISLSLVLNYDDWKKVFSENLARYDKEKGY